MTAAAQRLEAYLDAQARLPTLRFITCGSVDDGKSTLIGRLLYDSKQIFEDQLAALENASARHGTTGDAIDLALLMDGLLAEREQGITIDVAYRFFATERRRFIVADCPGHEQYTRNMATGASTADLAVILIDARKGVIEQTRRHSFIAALFGVRHVVLAVNKMDLVNYDQARFNAITADYGALGKELGFETVVGIPVCARDGDNIFNRRIAMPWHSGPTLIECLESAAIETKPNGALRLPVQLALRPDAGFRGYCGRLAQGDLAVGDSVMVYPSGRTSRIARILTMAADKPQAQEGESVTIALADEIDISRGDLLAAGDQPPHVGRKFTARLLWVGEESMLPGRRYILRLATQTAGCAVTALKHKIDINSYARQAVSHLEANDIGMVEIETERPFVFDAYRDCRATGGFILVDSITGRTLGAGVIDHALRRDENIRWHPMDVDRAARAAMKGQKPCVLWLTGLPGAGKSTIANALEKMLYARGRHTYLLDGDNIRHGLNRNLGFTPEARVENVRRTAEAARLLMDAGLIVIVSLISPMRADRAMARALFKDGEFIEVHIATKPEECERRDPKGLYKKARAGEIPNFTGVNAPYEDPLAPDFRLETEGITAEEAALALFSYLQAQGY